MVPGRRRYKAEIVAKYVAASAEAVAAREAAEVSRPIATERTAVLANSETAAVGPQDPARRGCWHDDQVDEAMEQHEKEAFAACGQDDDSDDANDDEDGEESGGFFGGKFAEAWAKADEEAEEDVLDEALDALLDAEVEGSGEAYANRFTDDFDVLAAQADAGIAETGSSETESEPAARAAGRISGDRKRRRKR